MDFRDSDRTSFRPAEGDSFGDDMDTRSRRRELMETSLRSYRLRLDLLGGGRMLVSSISHRESLGDGPGPGRLITSISEIFRRVRRGKKARLSTTGIIVRRKNDLLSFNFLWAA